MATISRLSVSLTANTRRFVRGIGRAKATLGGFVSSIFNFKTAIAGLVGAAGIGFLAKNIIDVNSRFQTLKSSLKTVTGGTKQAAEAFSLIEKFATTTPFDLEQVVGSFIKLKALGLDPSEAALKSYGNTAAAMGKSLDQFIEAVSDASVGEFERLKEFGIKAKSEGDRVTFTFQGVSTTVGKNAEEIQGYLQSIGNVNFAGAMEDQMGNLGPAFDNLGTALNLVKMKIGEAGINTLVSSIANSMTDLINNIKTEDIERFTKAVIEMGFSLVRSVINGIVWVGGLIDEVGSLESIWLNIKKVVAEFGVDTIGVVQVIISSFLQMKDKISLVMIGLQVGFLASIVKIREIVGALKTFSGEPLVDPQRTADLAAQLELLKIEQLKLGLGMGDRTVAVVESAASKMKSVLAGINGEIASEAQRAARSAPEITLKAKLGNFKEGAEEFLKDLELKVAGEQKAPESLVGTDPTQERIANTLESIDTKFDVFGELGSATAG